MIGRIQTNQLRELLEELSSRRPNAGGPVQKNNADVSVQVNYNSLIEKALQPSKSDGDIVKQARNLIISGKLESPKNCKEAAENIAQFGI